jgi:hypothetical protein
MPLNCFIVLLRVSEETPLPCLDYAEEVAV